MRGGDRLALTVCGLRLQWVVTTGHAHMCLQIFNIRNRRKRNFYRCRGRAVEWAVSQ